MATAPSPAALLRAKTLCVDAVKKGNVAPCLSIVQHGFPVDAPIMDVGMNLLMIVAAECSADQVNEILTLEPDVNARDAVGRTALHFACRAGNIATFKVLAALDDIDVDAVTLAGVTPLMMAVESGQIQLVAEGLNSNLNPFMRDGLDRAALDYAQKYKGNLGNDLRQLISTALNQWLA